MFVTACLQYERQCDTAGRESPDPRIPVEAELDWISVCYQIGCALALQVALVGEAD